MDGHFVAWILDRSVVSDLHEADKNEKRTQNQSRRRIPAHRAEARPQACSRHPRACIAATSSRRPCQVDPIDVPLCTTKFSRTCCTQVSAGGK